MTRRGPSRQGYVLLLVLMVLVICSGVLAMAASHTVQAASGASAAQRRLQLRWGCLTLRDGLLTEVGPLLDRTERKTKRSCARLRHTVPLGGMEFQLLLADECAKANVNVLVLQGSQQTLPQSLDRLQAGATRPLTVRLRPRMEPDIANPSVPARFESLDQVFALDSPGALAEAAKDGVALGRVTCWGGGQVNLHRAERPVIQEVLGDRVSPAQLDQLEELRRSGKPFVAGQALLRMQLNTDRINAILPLVTDVSNCYSMWVRVEDGPRQWHRLYVRQQSAFGREPRVWSEAW